MYLYLSVLLPFAYINRFTLLIKLLLSYLKINLKLTDLLLTLYNLQTITLVQTDYYSGSAKATYLPCSPDSSDVWKKLPSSYESLYNIILRFLD